MKDTSLSVVNESMLILELAVKGPPFIHGFLTRSYLLSFLLPLPPPQELCPIRVNSDDYVLPSESL